MVFFDLADIFVLADYVKIGLLKSRNISETNHLEHIYRYFRYERQKKNCLPKNFFLNSTLY